MRTIASRPRRGESLGTVKGLLVYVSENWQRFFDDLANLATRATAEDGDTTPSVKGLGLRGILTLANTGATNVTDLIDGLDLQEVVLKATTGNTTLINSAAFRLSGGGNIALAANSMLVMKLDNGVWHQVSSVVTT